MDQDKLGLTLNNVPTCSMERQWEFAKLCWRLQAAAGKQDSNGLTSNYVPTFSMEQHWGYVKLCSYMLHGASGRTQLKKPGTLEKTLSNIATDDAKMELFFAPNTLLPTLFHLRLLHIIEASTT